MSDAISDLGRECLRWALTDGVGPILFARLLERFGDLDAMARASASALCEVDGVGPRIAAGITAQRGMVPIDAEIAAAEQHGVRIIGRLDPDYPAILAKVPDPPIVLHVKGELRPTDQISLALVGSRRCSIYGSEQARRFGELLAGVGITVVSGLARGIDAFGHHGALDAGGRSLAVMGCGLNEVYPPENRALAERLLTQGAWISELPMATAVRATNFPSRNRIIAGLTLGTLVVEAADRSGALITARLASEYNREVFAIPGRLQEPGSNGTNALIRDGAAKLVTSLEDILNELGDVGTALRKGQAPATHATGASAQPAPPKESPIGPNESLTPVETRILAILDGDPRLQDNVIQAVQLPAQHVLAALTSLELKGLVRRLPGQRVARRGSA